MAHLGQVSEGERKEKKKKNSSGKCSLGSLAFLLSHLELAFSFLPFLFFRSTDREPFFLLLPSTMRPSVTVVAREHDDPALTAASPAEAAPDYASEEKATTKKASLSPKNDVANVVDDNTSDQTDPAEVDARVRALYYVMQSVEVSA